MNKNNKIMERRKFTKGLLTVLALAIVPVTYVIEKVKQKILVKHYTVKFKYDFKTNKTSKLDWTHVRDEEIEI